MRGHKRAAGQLEAEVLAALWAASAPLTPAQVLAAVDGDLAYNTVHTILIRLLEKGQLARIVHNGRHGYAPVTDAAGVAAERMRAVLDSGGVDRAATLARFVTELTPGDEAALRAALSRRR